MENMGDNTKENLELMLRQLVGKPIWGLSIGPAGVHLHFGEKHPDPHPSVEPHGDYSIWVKGGIQITTKAKTLWESRPYPSMREAPRLSALLGGKIVSVAAIDFTMNALRIVLNDEVLFSAYPLRLNEEDCPWILYDHLKPAAHYMIVRKDGAELVSR